MADSENIFSEEGLRLIFRDSHDAFIISDSNMKIVYANKTARNMFGYNENELIGLSILHIMPEDRRNNYLKDMESAVQGNTVSNIESGEELFGQIKNGEIFPIELTYSHYNFDRRNYFVSQIRDISERKQREKELSSLTIALRVISEVNRLIVSSNDEKEYLVNICNAIVNTGKFPRAAISIIEDTADGDKLIKNLAHLDYTSEIPAANHFLSELNPESLTAIVIREKRTEICNNIIDRNLWKYWVDDPSKIEFESTIAVPIIYSTRIEGVLRIFSKNPFYFSEDKVQLLEELAKDISRGIAFIRTKLAHCIALKALEESEHKYKILFQSSNDAIFIADTETGVIIDVNAKTDELLGMRTSEMIGKQYFELCPEGYEKRYRELFNSHIMEGSNITDEFYIRTKNGKAIPVQISANIAFINGKKVIQGIFRDISKSKMEEEKIRVTQKMEALGTLSGGIAHDINNILSPIIGFTQLAILETDNKEKLVSYLNEVLTASNRAKDLVAQILTFCQNSETDKKPHFIQNIVKEVVKLISVSTPENIDLQIVIDENCEPVLCDPIQIYQIIINLCTNATYAMKDTGGVLKVCLVRKGSPEIKSENSDVLPDDNYICLIVSDTGCGMSKTILNRIFEPYFSTKPKEEGTGLGLSVVSGIVKEHNGTIYVRTYPKEGTYFRILFPVTGQILKKKEQNKYSDIDRPNLNVMAVDDEPQITFMLKHMLEELGYSSETFNEPLSALASFKSDPQKYDLVITDQTMPKLLGTELSRKILEIRPDIPIILNTGFSPVASRSEANKIGIKKFMMKPITISELAITITEALKISETNDVKHTKYI